MDLEANILRAFISLWYLPLVKISKKRSWDKGDIIQKFYMIWHGITPLKTWILQIETTTEKNKLIGYLLLDEIKFCNLKNKYFEKWEKEPEKWKNIAVLYFMTTFHKVALKIESNFKLQRRVSPLWKLEMSMINVKTSWYMLKIR